MPDPYRGRPEKSKASLFRMMDDVTLRVVQTWMDPRGVVDYANLMMVVEEDGCDLVSVALLLLCLARWSMVRK